MTSISKLINKVSKALKAQGKMPLIDHMRFYGENGPVTKYVIHYGTPCGKKINVIAEVYSKIDLLQVLISLLKDGDENGQTHN